MATDVVTIPEEQGIETHGIERVSPTTRTHVRIFDNFTMWLSANLVLSTFALGTLAIPVFKLGLLAPFEGTGRAIAYEALYAVKLALQKKNALGGVAGWSVELVALDDGDDLAQTTQQARVLAADHDVMRMLVVVGDASAASEQLASLALPFAVIATSDQQTSGTSSAQFLEAYRAISGGITPGALALRTYAATQNALAQIEARIRTSGKPSR